MNMRNETLAMEDAIESRERERECVFYVYERERDRESWISLEEEVISAYCVCDRVYEIRI